MEGAQRRAVADRDDGRGLEPFLEEAIQHRLGGLIETVREGGFTVECGPDGTFAYVVDADNKAQVRPITVDIIEGDTTVISKGLKAGDQVVVDGQYQLKAGIKVSPSAPAGPKDAKAAGEDAPAATAKPTGDPKGSKPPKPGASAKAPQ